MSEIDRDDDIKIETEEGTDIEKEDRENIVDTIPFNPNDIKVTPQTFNLGVLIDMLEHHEIEIYTEFQRHPDLWNETKKSRFIESLLLRLPVPMFYFDVQADNLWRIIDGLQRVSTLRHFVLNKENPLVLKNLEFLKEYEDKTYEELPRPLQRRIFTSPTTVYLIDKSTPDVVKYNIFNRINQGGLKLTAQEMRHALNQGVATDLIADLVRGVEEPSGLDKRKEATEEGKAFVRATDGKVPTLRMQDRDFATRFVAFYLTSYTDYEPGLDNFMNTGLKKLSKISPEEQQQLKGDFKRSMNVAWEIFGDEAFRKVFIGDKKKKPINKALFEVLSVSFAKISEESSDLLVKNKTIFKDKFLELLNDPNGNLLPAITQSTPHKKQVKQRFEDIQTIIQETLQHAE